MVRALVRLGIWAAHFRALGGAIVFFATTALCFGQAATQQYIYANTSAPPATTSTLSEYAKNGQTGALSPAPGSPIPDRFEGGQLAVDALGRLLFVLNQTTNSISMYQINSSTGVLTEVPNSPFSAGATINPNQAPSQPVSLATEKSGKYLYVGYRGGNVSSFSAITPFNIDAANFRLTLTGQLSFDVSFNPLQMFSDPRGLFLYVVNGPNPFTGAQNGGATVYSIAETNGTLTMNGSAGSGSQGRCMASDPRGRFFYSGGGEFEGSLYWGTISPLDGTSDPDQNFLQLGENNYPFAMIVDSSGKFLYVQQSSGLVIYSIDQTTGQPTVLTSPLASPIFQLGGVVADPAGPYIFSGFPNGIHAYQVNSQNGLLTEISGSPFPANGAASNIAISGTSVQAISGPSATFDRTSLNFGGVTQGQPVTLLTHLVNNGDQTLSINLGTVAIQGTNASDFSQTTTCLATLSPNASCSFSVTFNPTTTTVESATLQISDNAPSSPQNISLTGTGVAPSPSLAFVPTGLTFNPIAQGSTEGPQSFQVTNIGSAVLHISNVALGGTNPGDFSQTNNCIGVVIAVNAGCTIDVTFTPLATGGRSASITLTDDAPTTTQTLFVTGSGAVAFQLNPALQSTTTASVSAGQTAQYALQLNPGTGFTGNVSLSCTGAPLAAKCSVSSGTLNVASSNAVPFSVSISTTGSTSALVPTSKTLRAGWSKNPQTIIAVFVLLLLWIPKRKALLPARFIAVYATLIAIVFVAGISGCGGGNNVITPPPQFVSTPKGMYTITVSATAGSLPSQTISLTLTVN